MALRRPKEVKFEFPQPPYPYPPSHRSGAMVGSSGSGKTSTAIAMLLGPYKKVYSRVYVWSPSCGKGVDPLWDAWRKHVADEMQIDEREEQTMWDTWQPQEVERLVEKNKKINAVMKQKGYKKGFVCLFLIDDFADAGDSSGKIFFRNIQLFSRKI